MKLRGLHHGFIGVDIQRGAFKEGLAPFKQLVSLQTVISSGQLDRADWFIGSLDDCQFLFGRQASSPLNAGDHLNSIGPRLRHIHIRRRIPSELVQGTPTGLGFRGLTHGPLGLSLALG